MNILYSIFGECCPTVGGTERTTDVMSRSLTRIYGHRCFCLYQKNVEDPSVGRTPFAGKFHMPVYDAVKIADIIRENEIDVIVSQEGNVHSRTFGEAIKKSGRKCALVYVHHSLPFAHERAFLSFGYIFDKMCQTHKYSDSVKLVTYPFYRKMKLGRHRRWFRETRDAADTIVLLSGRYADAWCEVTGTDDRNKIEAIPNPLSFDGVSPAAKEHRVLMVTRLSRVPKRPQLALDVWKLIEDDPRFDDWWFDIVGEGPDAASIKTYASKLGLRRVSFLGQCDPLEYYRRSSIFFMTSSFEGWGMTLTEAGQAGAVSLAFDTYASLHDILADGDNGFIIPEGDIHRYADKTKELMLDEDLCARMGNRAVTMARRFTADRVAEQWHKVLTEAYARAHNT